MKYTLTLLPDCKMFPQLKKSISFLAEEVAYTNGLESFDLIGYLKSKSDEMKMNFNDIGRCQTEISIQGLMGFKTIIGYIKSDAFVEPVDYIISPVTTFDEDEELWQTKVGTKGKNMLLHYTVWGVSQENSRSKAEALARILTKKLTKKE
jgi:hypothetical protein